MLIAIPSKGRAGNTTTDKVLPNIGTFFVPQSELHQYQPFIKNVVPVPINIQGITATRNWILKNTESKWVGFIDDDFKNVGWNKCLERNTVKIKLEDEGYWKEEFIKYFDITEQMGYKIWGLKTESSPRSNYPYKPFQFQSYVTASCMGIINDGEYMFNEEFKVKEDYEICCRHIKEKGGILTVRYCHWENEHWENEHWEKVGGCKDYRTVDMERDAIKRLIKMYPSMVKSAKRKASEFTIQLNF